ncbi:MAG: hypothetical protein H7196_01165 [candidate division SR1 bacterium]|nr:hypothetical protein [candidate division SR1 bacterium]
MVTYKWYTSVEASEKEPSVLQIFINLYFTYYTMPIFNQLIAGSMAVVGLGGAGMMASNNPTIKADFTNVQTAITNKNLSAYKTAEKQLISDRTSSEITRIDASTQDQLNTMSDRQAKRKAVQDAITNNDYNAFKANAGHSIFKRVTDQASFDKLVAGNKTQIESKAKESDAIKNNDFAAFKVVKHSEQANEMNNKNSRTRETLTDAELQIRFDQLVANYKADGSLPSDQKEKEFRDFEMGGRGHGGGHGQNLGNDK